MSRVHPLQVSINGLRGRSFHLSVPDAIDTLAELCRFISEEVPLPGPVQTRERRDPIGSRGYRFLYSVSGEPLWRVAECLELGHVVASETPGFIEAESPSQPARIPRHLDPSTTSAYRPEIRKRQAECRDGGGGRGGSRSPSPSSHSSSTSNNDHNGHPSPSNAGPSRPHLVSSWTTPLSSSSVTLTPATLPPPLPQAGTESKPYRNNASTRVDAAVARSAATRRHSTSSRGEMSAPRGLSTSPSPMRPVPHAPLQHQSDPISFLSNIEPLVVNHQNPSGSAIPSQQHPIAAASLRPTPTPSQRPPSHSLLRQFSPDIPVVFTPVASSPAVVDWNKTTCEMLLARKWRAFQRIRHQTNLLGRVEVQQRLEGIARQRKGVEAGTPLRIVVSGPPGSGVSTTAAMLVQEILHTRVDHQQQNSFCGYLLLPLDLPLLLEQDLEAHASGSALGQGTDSIGTQLIFWCEMILHSVVDAVVAGRRQLHLTGAVLVEFWMSILCPTCSVATAQRVRQDTVVMVGEDVVRDWEVFAQQGSHLLREATAPRPSSSRSGNNNNDNSNTIIRDAALQFIFRDMPIYFAQSMKFVGVFYIVDGLEQLCRGCGSLARPLGDLTTVLRVLCDRNRTAHVHTILCFSERSPSQALSMSYISGLTAWMKTIGFLPLERAGVHGIPKHLHCFEDSFPVEIFLGAPGYLAAVYKYCGLKESQSHKRTTSAGFCARLDFANVQQELKQLQRQIESFYR